jgi:hemoglobin
MNMYEAVGGEATFLALTDAFYDQVAADPLLRPLFPENMEPGKRRLAHFLIESFGGPPRWSRERHFAHLANAHHRRAFSEAERDAWINHMLAAIDTVGIAGSPRRRLREWIISNADLAMSHRPLRQAQITVPE